MILDIIRELENTPGTNDKKALLEKHKSDPVLKRVLQYGLDDSLNTGIKIIPSFTGTTSPEAISLNDAMNELDELYEGRITGNAGRAHLQKTLDSLHPDDAEVLVRIVRKKLNIGVQGKNANAVFGSNFIPIEPYMRCELISKKTINNIVSLKTLGYAYSECKMDGQYINIICRGGNVTFMSRNGKEYDFLGFKDEDILALKEQLANDPRFDSGVVFMGECLVLDEDDNFLPRTTGNGIVQKAGKGTISQSEAQRVCFVLWDVVPFKAYRDGIWNVQRSERRTTLLNAISGIQSTYVRLVEHRKVHNLDEVFDYNAELMAEGHEGTVLKCETGIWKSHTSPKQLKVKMVMEFDLVIVGFNEGEDKRKGTLGSIAVQSADGLVQVNVGTGFKEKDATWTLDTIWAKRDELLGKVLTVKSNGLVRDKKRKDDVQKLFIPAFLEFRFDKETADDLPRINKIIESAVQVLKENLKRDIK